MDTIYMSRLSHDPELLPDDHANSFDYLGRDAVFLHVMEAIVEAIGATDDNGVAETVVAVSFINIIICAIEHHTTPLHIRHISLNSGTNVPYTACVAVCIFNARLGYHVQSVMNADTAVTTVHAYAITPIDKIFWFSDTGKIL